MVGSVSYGRLFILHTSLYSCFQFDTLTNIIIIYRFVFVLGFTEAVRRNYKETTNNVIRNIVKTQRNKPRLGSRKGKNYQYHTLTNYQYQSL
jgi:hypothetical protein